MNEATIRNAAKSYMSDRMSKGGVRCLLGPMVWHGKGSLSKNLNRRVDLNPIRGFDPAFDQDLDYMDIEPDLVAVCAMGQNALTVVGECKSRGNLAVSNLAQVLLYSSVSKAVAGAMFFTGSPTQPVRKILDDEVLLYRG